MFVLNSDITIGNFRFSGVNDVTISRSLHGISDTAVITIPSIARIIKDGKAMPDTVLAGKQFKDGDPVVIKLGYNSEMQTEFVGFVKKRNLGMPLSLECEGYSWLLRRNKVEGFWKTISVKDLLEKAVSGLEGGRRIKVRCDIDMILSNVRISEDCGFNVISNIGKYTDGCVSCFFIEPDVLWCGIPYSLCSNEADPLRTGKVSYRLGYNVVRENSLKERLMNAEPMEVRYTKRLSGGHVISATPDVFKKFSGGSHKTLNHIHDSGTLKQLANEKAYRHSYSGYEGKLNAFLQPFAAPGYLAFVADDRYPERNGNYLVESTEVRFGVDGARRIVEVGPKTTFAK